MSTVYLAERTDGEIQQKVAIKFLRTDIQRPAWRELFLKERQLLAYLNHPSIAHLIDAGHTDDGQPYLVMEYVDGVAIDEYTKNLDLRECLSLFLQVCDGVSHAHRRLIIHRDLKPSNILVDTSGGPKILDFGIARLIDETANRTQTAERLLTPNYASPEQLRGTAHTTATDVYSLGAVLHKIMTGNLPNDLTGSHRELPGDLEHVLRKALRTEPDERYVSVEAFANDIRAFLDWRPVQARAGDLWYQTRKLLRRHRATVSAAVLVVAGLSAGLYVANRERNVAERRFEQVRQLSNKVLTLDNAIKGLPGATKARNEIVTMSKDYLESLMADGLGRNDYAFELANAFFKVAEIQGVPSDSNLGQYAQADESLTKAGALVDQVLVASPHDSKALFLSALINHDRMLLARDDQRRDATQVFARKSADRIEAFLATGNTSGNDRREASRVFNNLALTYKNLHLYNETIRYARRAVDVGRSGPDPERIEAYALTMIADSLRYGGDLEGALKAVDQAKSLLENYNFPNDILRANSLFGILWRKGLILGSEGQISLMLPDEAIILFQQAFDLIENVAVKDPNDSLFRMLFFTEGREFGNVLRHRDPKRALAVYDHSQFRLSEIKNNDKARRGEALLLAASSYPLRSLNRTDEAQQRIDKAFELLRQTKSYPVATINTDDETETVLRALGDQLAATGQTQRAIETYQELLEKLMASHPDPQNDLRDATALSRIYEALTRLHLRNGDPEPARLNSALRLKIWQNWNRKLPNSIFVQRELSAASSS
jgi:tetratricopeptide (TPR) repeat protein